MQYSTEFRGREQEIVDLFAATFTASDGMAEGELTGGLVRKLMCGTPRKDIHLFTTWDNGLLVAGAVLGNVPVDVELFGMKGGVALPEP
ncbi:hypothetical protein HUK65_17005 [Rhodobacteraceae bacterium 2376]|uniref:GNAT family N-acetyltransferase n=1 Tax=Rhabdonatronobacter sediminivivens TaxID=2743469 RepID=A0A7Z0I2E1_9RHOB|nr:hypothetical protein [Rhabdonatronobacter sediminivivens]NYS26683.1 hypothetical protein [Rhabdonatronobacter sediminivivens]